MPSQPGQGGLQQEIEEQIVICNCGANLKVKTHVRSHCPRCKHVFNEHIATSKEEGKIRQEQEEGKRRKEDEAGKGEEEKWKKRRRTEGTERREAEDRVLAEEKIVICDCGANLKVKTHVRSHCPRCKHVFNRHIATSKEEGKIRQEQEEGKRREEDETGRRQEEEEKKRRRTEGTERREAEDRVLAATSSQQVLSRRIVRNEEREGKQTRIKKEVQEEERRRDEEGRRREGGERQKREEEDSQTRIRENEERKRRRGREGEEECVVCMEASKLLACVPCGHVCLCSRCAGAVQKSTRTCPMCRAPTRQFLQLFF